MLGTLALSVSESSGKSYRRNQRGCVVSYPRNANANREAFHNSLAEERKRERERARKRERLDYTTETRDLAE